MTLALEQEIMSSIGLGMPYNWYNGSTVDYIRREAIEAIGKEIDKAKAEGKEIAGYDNRFTHVLNQIDKASEDRHTLTKVWEACSYVIQAHMYAYFNGVKDLNSTLEYLKENYVPKPKPADFYERLLKTGYFSLDDPDMPEEFRFRQFFKKNKKG